MRHHRVRFLLTLSVLLAMAVIVYVALEIYRDSDQLSYFVDLKGEIVSTRETALEESPTHSLLQIELRDDRGLEVVGYLKVPISDGRSFPALVALGGVRTGKNVLDYIEDTHGVVVLALDYPYEGKKNGLSVREFVSKIPDIRRALFNTVPTTMLAVDYLLQRDDIDPDRIVLVGGSVGALIVPAAAAADQRVDGVALLFGAGDLEAVLRANIPAPAPFAALGAWTAAVAVSPLEPLKYVGRISPRPLFMLNGTGDDRMPVRSSELLNEKAGEPKTVRWIDAGHVHIRSPEFHQKVTDEFIAWLVEHDLAESETVAEDR
jgi:dienelactone hydrolase